MAETEKQEQPVQEAKPAQKQDAAKKKEEKGPLEWLGDKIVAGYNAAMRGGELQAAFRQGFNELGTALKTFPDSLQVDEPGAVLKPLYRDIPSESTPPSPSEIAEDKSLAPTVHGDSKEPLLSPSQIAETPLPQQTGQERGGIHGQQSPSQIAEANLDRGSVHGLEKPLVDQEQNQRQGATLEVEAAINQADLSPDLTPAAEHRGRGRSR